MTKKHLYALLLLSLAMLLSSCTVREDSPSQWFKQGDEIRIAEWECEEFLPASKEITDRLHAILPQMRRMARDDCGLYPSNLSTCQLMIGTQRCYFAQWRCWDTGQHFAGIFFEQYPDIIYAMELPKEQFILFEGRMKNGETTYELLPPEGKLLQSFSWYDDRFHAMIDAGLYCQWGQFYVLINGERIDSVEGIREYVLSLDGREDGALFSMPTQYKRPLRNGIFSDLRMWPVVAEDTGETMLLVSGRYMLNGIGDCEEWFIFRVTESGHEALGNAGGWDEWIYKHKIVIDWREDGLLFSIPGLGYETVVGYSLVAYANEDAREMYDKRINLFGPDCGIGIDGNETLCFTYNDSPDSERGLGSPSRIGLTYYISSPWDRMSTTIQIEYIITTKGLTANRVVWCGYEDKYPQRLAEGAGDVLAR